MCLTCISNAVAENYFAKSFEQGRALVWQTRQSCTDQSVGKHPALVKHLQASKLASNNRVAKNVDALLKLSDAESIKHDNSDESVTEFDDRIAKAYAKAKVVAAVVGEPLHVDSQAKVNAGIEESSGLNARK